MVNTWRKEEMIKLIELWCEEHPSTAGRLEKESHLAIWKLLVLVTRFSILTRVKIIIHT